MSWDRKQFGPTSGYFYESRRLPDKPSPVKVYRGRGELGKLAASLVEERRRERQLLRDARRAGEAQFSEANQLATERLD